MRMIAVPTRNIVGLKRYGCFACFLCALLMVCFIFRDTIGGIFEAWQMDEYSHELLVPFVFLFLIFSKEPPRSTKKRFSYIGLLLVIFSVLLFLFFSFIGVNGFLPQALVTSYIGIFLAFFGGTMSWHYKGALVLLFFATPLPNFIYYALSVYMQILSTNIGVSILFFLNIPVFQEGNLIDLGVHQLEVIEACNGLRYIFPLMTLSFIFAYYYNTSFIKRSFVFLSALPLSLLMNGLRIAFIGITVTFWGKDAAEGLLHDLEGFIIFALCFIILLTEIKLLQFIGKPGSIDPIEMKLCPLSHWPAPACDKVAKLTFIFLILSSILSVFWAPLTLEYKAPIPPKSSLKTFSFYSDKWQERKGTLGEKEKELLAADDFVLNNYTNGHGKGVTLYALYYPKQDISSNQAQHRPTLCLPGSGWEIVQRTLKKISLGTDSDLEVNRLVAEKDGGKILLYFWYIQGGKNIADPNLSKLETIKNALLLGRTNGAMVRYSTEVNPEETEDRAELRLNNFIKESYPVLYESMFVAQKDNHHGK